jgi:hypothetical protein
MIKSNPLGREPDTRGFPQYLNRLPVSDESIPEKGGRKNVSEIARTYHAATTYGILVDGFLSEGDHVAEKKSDAFAIPNTHGISSSLQSTPSHN